MLKIFIKSYMAEDNEFPPTLLVSIVSEQPLPNLVFILAAKREGMRYIFLSTEKMEKRGMTESLLAAADIHPDEAMTFEISPEDPKAIRSKLMNVPIEKGAKILLNATGGTKIMSQTVIDHIRQEYPDSRIVYAPLQGSRVTELYPSPGLAESMPLPRIDLFTYIRSHGFEFSCQEEPVGTFQECEKIMQKVISSHGISKVEELKDVHTKYSSADDKRYYSGAWFEEWVYYTIRSTLKLSEDEIMLNLHLRNVLSAKEEHNNEIDIAFTYNNKLYAVECKAHKSYDPKKLNAAAAKMSMLSRILGLNCRPIMIFCTHVQEENLAHITDMTTIFGMKAFLSLDDLRSREQFRKRLNELLEIQN
jgi:hypothetical protein